MELYCTAAGQTRFNRPRLSLANPWEVKGRSQGRWMCFNCPDLIAESILTFSRINTYLTFLVRVHEGDFCKSDSREGF